MASWTDNPTERLYTVLYDLFGPLSVSQALNGITESLHNI